jgi:hypothetical protein
MQFKSYPSEGSSDFFRAARIWRVAGATSAAPSFFDPIQIGRAAEGFSDRGTGANNPVETIWIEAPRTLPLRKSLENYLKCLVSIGTGITSPEPFGNNLRAVAKRVIAIATDTEIRAKKFESAHSELTERYQYFRFNVQRGLENIGIEDAAQARAIMAAIRDYLDSEGLKTRMQQCGRRLKSRGRIREAQTPSSPWMR